MSEAIRKIRIPSDKWSGEVMMYNLDVVIAADHILMTMVDWSSLLQRYMDLNNRPVLPDAGRVTHEQAVEKALTEYDKFRVIQDREIMSDFDLQLKLLFGDR